MEIIWGHVVNVVDLGYLDAFDRIQFFHQTRCKHRWKHWQNVDRTSKSKPQALLSYICVSFVTKTNDKKKKIIMILFRVESRTALFAFLTSLPVVMGGGWWYHDYDDYYYSSDSSSSDSSSDSHDYDDFYHTCGSVGTHFNKFNFDVLLLCSWWIDNASISEFTHDLSFCSIHDMRFICTNNSRNRMQWRLQHVL